MNSVSWTLHDSAYRLFRMLGIKDSYSRIMSTILLAEKPLTMKEIAERTEYSLSLVSLGLESLVNAGFIERTKKGRKALFTLEHDIKRVYSKFLARIKEELEIFEKEVQREMEILKDKDIGAYTNLKTIFESISKSKDLLNL